MRFIPHWRKATWAIVIWTVLSIIWVITGVNAAADTACDPALTQKLCDTATGVGTGIGVTLIFIVWLIGFIILSIIWFMSRPRYVEYDGQMMSEKDAVRLSTAKARAIKEASEKGGGKPTPAT